jgi:hypothetical protein
MVSNIGIISCLYLSCLLVWIEFSCGVYVTHVKHCYVSSYNVGRSCFCDFTCIMLSMW